MNRTSNFKTFLDQISDIDLDEVNDLYETITSGINHGSYKYVLEGDWIIIENRATDFALILSSDAAKKTILNQLDKDWGGEMEDVLAYWEFKRQMNKDD